ncbi:MAG: hypothetical protein PHF44_01985 [Candidatus Pacebacteria bacterium]|nr:hypothetical protein [Candidatus Paceibacterota bacterium]
MPPEVLAFSKTIWQFIHPFLKPIWEIFKDWWWVPLPFILWKRFLFMWLWWKNEKWLYSKEYRPVMLEIKIPREILKPIRAMEAVMSSLHAVIYHPPDWWEKWIDGQLQLSMALEIVSIGGAPHFFIRFNYPYRKAVEAALYSQYPNIEIQEVDDYSKYVPQDIPNKEWDLWAADYRLLKPDPYPIKTYAQFETESEALEEKRIDPIADLLEAMAKMTPDEQLWIQIRAEPLSQPDENAQYAHFLKEGEEIRDKIARRKKPPEPVSMLKEMVNVISGNPSAPPAEEKEMIPSEMKMTPGEREIITAVEQKMSKPAFSVGVRFIYLGKRDVFYNPNFRLAFTYFNEFVTANLNNIQPFHVTKIKKSWFLPYNLLRPRRDYLRCRRLFRNYRERFSPFYPRFKITKGTFILNTEELASLYHFPSAIVSPVPTIPRIESKRGGPPPELPV